MAFEDLATQRYIALTTFRRDGSPVTTTVWFASLDDGLVIGTMSGSGKVKRMQRDGTVTLAASNFRGRRKTGEVHAGRARLLGEDAADPARDALADKYGIQWKAVRRKIDTFFLITPHP